MANFKLICVALLLAVVLKHADGGVTSRLFGLIFVDIGVG
jgi:hypothetical protein